MSYLGRQTDRSVPLNIVLGNYIGFLFDQGLSFGSINTKKSAISVTYLLTTGVQLVKDEIVSRVMKGVNMKVPARARYEESWDIDLVLDFFHAGKKNRFLSTVELRTKTSVLFMIAMIARSDNIRKLRFPHSSMSDKVILFTSVEKLKNQGLGKVIPLQVRKKHGDHKICPYRAYIAYSRRVRLLRSEDSIRIFINVKNPFRDLSKDRISNKVTVLLHKAGVPLKYTCHSIRMAVASKLIEAGVSVEDVMAASTFLTAFTIELKCGLTLWSCFLQHNFIP